MNVARLRSPVYALCLSILAVAAACGTADVPPKPKATTTGTGGTASTTGSGGSSSTAGSAGASTTTGAGGSTGGGAGTATGTGGAGGTDVTTGVGGAGGAGGSGPPPIMGPITPLPVVVDSSYAASGYMGDGVTAGSIVADVTCPMRAPGNIGKCSKFTYTPQAMSTPQAMAYGWGGVYWQYPANNWGTLQGERIAAGATKVTFYAAGAKGGEKVNFFVGGITGPTYQDPPKVSLDAQVLTTTMTAYTINLTGFTYDAVMGGFGWSIEAPAGADAGIFDPTPIVFYVDAIQWVM